MKLLPLFWLAASSFIVVSCAEHWVAVKKNAQLRFTNELLPIAIVVGLEEPRNIFQKALLTSSASAPLSSSSSYNNSNAFKNESHLPWPYISVLRVQITNLSKEKISLTFSNQIFLSLERIPQVLYTPETFYGAFPVTRYESERMSFLFDRQSNLMTQASNSQMVFGPSDKWDFYLVYDGFPLEAKVGDLRFAFSTTSGDLSNSGLVFSSSITLSNERVRKGNVRTLL